MVGYNDVSEHQLPEFWQGVAGTASGVLCRLFVQPFDVLKIRFQLQHEPLIKSSDNYYWNLQQAASRIVREESIRALWKGHVPAQVLSGTYGLAQFLSFEVLTKILAQKYQNEKFYNKTFVHFLCGCVSGGLANAVSMPFDTVRTRLVGQGEPKIYRGVTHAFTSMIRNEGVLSLYKGLVPTLIQIVPNTGIQFAIFNVCTDAYESLFETGGGKLPLLGNLLCGSVAGLTAKVAVYPLDLTKKRLQVQGFEEARLKFGRVRGYSGMMNCLKMTFLEEGFAGLYKGLVPSCAKAMASTGLIFAFYEEISSLFKSMRL